MGPRSVHTRVRVPAPGVLVSLTARWMKRGDRARFVLPKTVPLQSETKDLIDVGWKRPVVYRLSLIAIVSRDPTAVFPQDEPAIQAVATFTIQEGVEGASITTQWQLANQLFLVGRQQIQIIEGTASQLIVRCDVITTFGPNTPWLIDVSAAMATFKDATERGDAEGVER